jgi:hypothetical protein
MEDPRPMFRNIPKFAIAFVVPNSSRSFNTQTLKYAVKEIIFMPTDGTHIYLPKEMQYHITIFCPTFLSRRLKIYFFIKCTTTLAPFFGIYPSNHSQFMK